jgi:hypothetical protein
LETSDAGKSWQEVSNLPQEYFTDAQGGLNWHFRNEWIASEKNSSIITSRPLSISWLELIG